AFTLAPGERLRLEIASSAFPLYDRNPSTNTPPHLADNWNWSRSTQQVLHSAAHPSAIYLPIVGEPGW
ncbi:MAG: CocE/NonD family hydrolase C-terminal non-catalytic domain-containing protein, partial [Terracidiphilus sp.]